MPKNVGRGEFKDEIIVLITLLSQVSGEEEGYKFQSWMHYIITQIINNREYFDWVLLINDTRSSNHRICQVSSIPHDIVFDLLGGLLK
jgi:hypothetical protein